MIKVFIPTDKEFNYKECKKLFKKNKKKLQESVFSFKEIVEKTFFYSFFDDDKHIGCIYYYELDGKMYIAGYAHRHMHKQTMECLRMSLDWFTCDINAITYQRHVKIMLLKAGFKKIDDIHLIYERK